MRFSFDSPEPKPDERLALTSTPPSTTPKDEMEWFPLQNHPVFSTTTTTASSGGAVQSSTSRTPTNLLAWDGASRLYFWDQDKHCLHRISIRLGEPHPSSVLAASPSKVLSLPISHRAGPSTSPLRLVSRGLSFQICILKVRAFQN